MIQYDALLNEAAGVILNSKYVIALTGAGISTESGIPDFRGPSGLWRRIDPYYATYTYFNEDPKGFWRLFIDLINMLESAEPNEAHVSLAKLEERGILKAVITQNIDGLHQLAGSKNVIEIHGNLRSATCRSCGTKYSLKYALDMVYKGMLPPKCGSCGGVLKPDVILFGEPLPHEALSRAYAEAARADLILILGTSLTVYPAAYIPNIVKERGGKVIIVNMEPTERDDLGDIVIHGKLGEVLPQLVDKIFKILG